MTIAHFFIFMTHCSKMHRLAVKRHFTLFQAYDIIILIIGLVRPARLQKWLGNYKISFSSLPTSDKQKTTSNSLI